MISIDYNILEIQIWSSFFFRFCHVFNRSS